MPWGSLYDVYLYTPHDYVENADNNQYSAWNRTRRLHAPTFLARVDTNASRAASALRTGPGANAGNANDVVINMGDLEVPGSGNINGKKEIKDTLFGPSIGVAGGGPDWCEKDSKDGKDVDEDELTPEVVKEWIRKSKDSSEPTTTLQALVNLKRPTIRLLPLASDHDPASSDSHLHAQHGLEFEFDCDAPRCYISLHAVGVPAHLAEDHPAHETEGQGSNHPSSEDRLLLFETTVEGGFGKKLHLDDGAILELAKLEHAARQAAAMAAAEAEAVAAALLPVDPSSPVGERQQAPSTKDHHRKRLTFLRKRENHSMHSNPQSHPSAPQPQASVAAGPALAVVDAESQQRASGSSTEGVAAGSSRDVKDKKKEDEEGGVKLSIRLAARDPEGKSLRVRNEQVTFLHIVRHGPSPSTVPAPGASEGESSEQQRSSAPDTEKGETISQSETEDHRPWVVKVVKREARIGPHAFHLHEIYGLTSHSAAPAHPLAPTAPTPAPDHTYPPTEQSATTPAPMAHADEADATAECLLCLSSPREVVLLPCRHLVACRECAVNMVEFGAGGTLVHSEPDPSPPAPAAAEAGSEAAPGTTDSSNGANTADGASAPPAPATPAPPAPTTRRKRKPKGWFCPVCRQPYTSLLRITTTPPPTKVSESESAAADAKRISVTSSVEPDHPLADSPTDATVNNGVANTNSGGMESRGTFASLTRPGFFRGFSRNTDRDVESASATPVSAPSGANAV